jgi:WD40 repeat protein
VPRGAIPEDAAHEHLVERLVQARLVTADADVLDLAHETLARAWPRLRGWLDDDLEGQRILRHLSTAAESWHAMGRPDAELYRGDRLVRAVAWHAASGADLTAHEADFLARSREVVEAAAAEAERTASARRRTRRRAEALIAVATTLAVVAGLAAFVALRERDQAAAERLVASARRAAAGSHATEDPVTSMLLAVEAVRRDDSSDTRATLLAALNRSPALVRAIPTHEGSWVRASADGTRIFGYQAVYDAESFEPISEGSDADAQLLAEPGREVFEDDANLVVETPGGHQQSIRPPGMEGWKVWQSSGDRTAHRLAAGFERESPDADRYESAVVVWDVDRPGDAHVLVEVPGTAAHGGIHDFTVDPAGNRIYVAVPDADAWLRTYDANTGDLLAALPALESRAALTKSARPLQAWDRSRTFIRLSHDGHTIAVNDGADVVLVDPETMDVTTRLRGHTHRVITAEFSSDDRLVAASALDGSTLVWDRASGALLERLEGTRSPVSTLSFAPDSQTLYGAIDGSILVWDLTGSRRFVSTVNDPVGQFGYLVVAAPDGDSAAYFRATVTTFGRDTEFHLVTAHGRPTAVGAGFANWGTYSPSGDALATVVNSRLQVWDPEDGHLLRQTKVPGIVHAEAATFTPDGSWLVVGDRDGTVQAVDADSLAPVGEQISVDQHLTDLVPAADGTGVVVLIGESDDDTWPYYVEVDPATGRVDEGALHSDGQANYAAVSPDGKRLAVTQEGLAGLIDLQTGRWIAGLTDAHGEIAARVEFNGDGTRFVTSGLDGRVVLWDGLTGRRLAAVQPLGPEFETGVAFLPDGHTVTIAASNGQMFRWDTDPEAWLGYACQVAGRNLSDEEWRSVFGSEPYRETCPQWSA